MKIYARQVPPEYQSPLWYDDEEMLNIDGLAIIENKRYKQMVTSDIEGVFKALENCGLYEAIENPVECGYKNAADVIGYYMPKASGVYTESEANALAAMVNTYDGTVEQLASIVSIVTGKRWVHGCIRGSSQSEWAYIIYDTNTWTEQMVKRFETEFFNEGSEWIVNIFTESDPKPENVNEMSGYSIYCHEWSDDDIKAEIAKDAGGDPEDVRLFKFDGWKRTPLYAAV